jgi:hypothetical protein
MSKLKINSGLVSLILVACLFSGWGTMLTVSVLLLIFCEMDERVKNIFVRVLSFFVAITLFSLLWDLITGGINLGIGSIKDLIDVINSYLSYDKLISLGKLDSYVFIPLQEIIDIADSIISYIIRFVEFGFAVSLFLNKPGKPNFVIKKIEQYINCVINFVNSFEMAPFNQNVQPQPAYNQMPQQPMNNNMQYPNQPAQNFNQNNM